MGAHGQRIKDVLAQKVGLEPGRRQHPKGDPKHAAKIAALGLLKGGDRVPAARAKLVFRRICDSWEESCEGGPGDTCDVEGPAIATPEEYKQFLVRVQAE